MTKKTGGGSATNSGIDYQQRVAACFQIFLYTQFEISQVLNEDFSLTIKSLHFETADAVDDLKLLCDKDHTLYLQVKRSISFSDSPESEFIKTLDQFIEQQSVGGFNNYYVLVTTSDSSRRLTGELRKILTSIRLNDTAFKLNPLNKSEQEVYNKFRAAFISRSLTLTGNRIDDRKFVEFAKRVYIEVMDVEAGMSLERSAKLLLVGRMQNPDLVWSLLIRNSLVYATNRASINRQALTNVLNNYRVRKNHFIDQDEFEAILRDAVILNGEYSCNKEVLILESEEGDKNEIMEIARFSDVCSKQLSFSNNKVKFINDSESLTLIYRGSSAIGLSRFVEQNPGALGIKPLVIFDLPAIERGGQEECIKLYNEYVDQLSKENRNIGNCLHCGKPVGKTENLLIEIDDDDTASAVGACHLACRRPMDRVLGTARLENELSSPYLEDFDFNRWVSLSLKGGIILDGLIPALQGKASIAWSGFPHQSDGDFCVKFQMEDGTKRFAFHRGKIERMTEQEATEHVRRFKVQLEKQKAENDLLGFTTKNRQYGVYSRLLLSIEQDDEFVAINDAEAVRYSQQEAKIHDTGRMYYAPLCYIADKHSGAILNISNMIPIISDPRMMDSLAKSWQRAGIDIEDLTLRILSSDSEVDIFFAQLFADKNTLVLNPLLDQNARLVKGFFISPAQDILQQQEEANEGLWEIDDPAWQKGDLVKIIVPDEDGPKKMFGQLLFDEALNEDDIRVVIFQPMENGKPVYDIELVIPSVLVSCWDGSDNNNSLT
ncbi:hypothetical protein TH53_25000 [Pedobacter lusitanus]|uniref:Uncharacterized protein n=1 Tax=Pedobacter lusitanus TaxID=1503925 RepID=A0A0D0FQE4_9SPHI|nr:hypothetical protein [Pedobacter lusitanus]KIO74689.1 hypothetical protein TH53_25000 [Pedobacter lusitanus]